MPEERYGMGPYPPRGRSRAEGMRKVIVNEAGAFAAPVSPSAAFEGSFLDDEQFYGDVPATDTETAFVYDDDPAWKQPISTVPIIQRHTAPMRKETGEPVKRRPQSGKKPLKKRGGGHGEKSWLAYVYVGIITLSVLGMCILGVMMLPQMAGYFWKDFGNYAFINGELLRYDKTTVDLYRQYRSYMYRDVIYPGIFVDGVHVGDMTVEEARAALTAVGSDAPSAFSVTVAIGNKTWTVDSTNVPAQRDLGNVLERAYAIGRTNTTDIQIGNQTPFRERTNTAIALRENGVNLTTTASYDHDAVRTIVSEIAAYVTRDPVDAQILTFDYPTQTFTFSEEQPGVTLDQDLLYEKITAALDRWEQGVTVTVDPVVTQASVTREFLSKNFKLVAAYTTDTTNDSNRNTNIDLACKAINGTTLLPGQTFSFNESTGQRTTDKGYKSAGAIAAGQSIEEVGGGICQVSSTLFNAVTRANLEIVSRSPHAWPSTYVNRGEDATVNWPNLDFKFKNNQSTPIFVITYYSNRKMSAEIWGMSLGEGVSIDLESHVTKTMEPPVDVKYVNNPQMPYNTKETTVKARTGYVVETYKVWYKDGQETSRELLHTSTYKAYQQVVEYN